MKALSRLLIAAAICCFGAFAQEPSRLSCPNAAPVSVSAAGSSVLIPAITGQSIHVCIISLTTSAATSIAFFGGATALTGPYQQVQVFDRDFKGDLRSGLSQPLSISLGSAVTAGGFISYYTTGY